jgi:hypothetical protein
VARSLFRAGALALVLISGIGIRAAQPERRADPRTVDRIAALIGTDRATATRIYNELVFFMRELGQQLGYLAESTDPIAKKDATVKRIIERYFTGPEARIEVSLATTGAVDDYPVRVYLHNLARLREREDYTSVDLFWRPNFMLLGEFGVVPDRQNTYEVAIAATQHFKGTTSEYTYADTTKKVCRVRFTVDRTRGRYRVQEILVRQTVRAPEMTLEP